MANSPYELGKAGRYKMQPEYYKSGFLEGMLAAASVNLKNGNVEGTQKLLDDAMEFCRRFENG